MDRRPNSFDNLFSNVFSSNNRIWLTRMRMFLILIRFFRYSVNVRVFITRLRIIRRTTDPTNFSKKARGI